MNQPSIDRQRREAADLLRSLANPNRLAILCALAERGRLVAELEPELGIRQPILSQQLAILRDAGLVETRKEQKSAFYCLSEPHADRVRRILRAAMGGEGQTALRQDEPLRRPLPRLDEAAVFARVEPFSHE